MQGGEMGKRKDRSTGKSRKRKAEKSRRTWIARLGSCVLVAVPASLFIALVELKRCTMINFTTDIFWLSAAAGGAALTAWAWIKQRLSLAGVLLHAAAGAVSGVFLCIFMVTLLLGANYVFSSSACSVHKVVVLDKKLKYYRRYTGYYVWLRFSDTGRHYMLDAGHDIYWSLKKGNACVLTLRKGLFGWPVIDNFEKASRSTSVDNTPTVTLRRIEEKFSYCCNSGRIDGDSVAVYNAVGIHEYCLKPFFRSALRTVASEGQYIENEAKIDYCNTHYRMMLTDSTRVSVDVLSMGRHGRMFGKWVAALNETDHIAVDVPAESPVRCLAFFHGPDIVLVWCMLSAPEEDIMSIVKRSLSK